jgi:hypothetical protein
MMQLMMFLSAADLIHSVYNMMWKISGKCRQMLANADLPSTFLLVSW